MTKAELIEAVAAKAEVTKADAERTLAAFFDQVVAVAKNDDKVAWPGFGSFTTKVRAARTVRNPQTGASMESPASRQMKFTASSTLKAILNPNKYKIEEELEDDLNEMRLQAGLDVKPSHSLEEKDTYIKDIQAAAGL